MTSPFTDTPPSYFVFRMKISGRALKEAINARIDREESAPVMPMLPGTAGVIGAEREGINERLFAVKLVAENLVDDELYTVSLPDLTSLATVQVPVLPGILSGILPLISMAGRGVPRDPDDEDE